MHLFELRPDIRFTPLVRDGVEMVVAHDPINDNYFDLQPAQHELLALADGRTSVEEISAALADAGIPFSTEEIFSFLAQASSWGLMTLSSLARESKLTFFEGLRARRLAAAFLRKIGPRGAGTPWRRAAELAAAQARRERIVLAARSLEEALELGGPPECRELLDQLTALQFRTVGWTPLFKIGALVEGDPVAAAVERALRPLLTPFWLAVFSLSAMTATAVVVLQFDLRQIRRSLDPVLTTVVLAISLALHELGHAVACRRVGARVGRLGLGLLYHFLPIAYADVSGTYLVPDRWRRVLVGAAGILVNQSLVALAFPFMALTAPGTTIHTVATAVVVMNAGTYLVNALPFIRLDGYYMLADLLGTPTLALDGDRAVASLVVPSASAERGTRLWLLRAYGLGSLAFRLGFFLFGVRFVYDFLGGRLGKAAALVLAGLLLRGFLYSLVMPPLKYLRAHPEALRTWRVQAALALLVAVVGVVPFRWTVTADGTVRHPKVAVRAAQAGRLIELAVQDGEHVGLGQVIGTVEGPRSERWPVRSPVAGRVFMPLDPGPSRWLEVGATVLEIASEERAEVSVALPAREPWPWEQLMRAPEVTAWVPSARAALALEPRNVRFDPAGTTVVLAVSPGARPLLDGAAATVRFDLGARPLAYQYLVETARTLRFELWMAAGDPTGTVR